MQELNDIREGFMTVLRGRYSQPVFDLWFGDMVLVSLNEERAVFEINSNFKAGYLDVGGKYNTAITAALEETIGFSVTVRVVSTEQRDGFSLPHFSSPVPSEIPENKRYEEEEKQVDIGPDIESKKVFEQYTFENFIVGESNKFAHSACVAVARNPASSWNPLFIYGQSGLGKTHLLYAITNEIKRTMPDVRIVYKKGDEFTNELIRSIQTGSMASFRNKYRNADVLLIDDIQFIAGRESTQEEFFHTFNALHDAERQIILTSDRPPRDIKTLEDRLRTRFEWGLIADIQPPSIELRTAIILKKAETLGITIPDEAVTYLSEKLKDNIRTIEGAIKKISAVTMLTGSPITLEMCKTAVASIVRSDKNDNDLIDRIFETVSRRYGVPVEEIRGKRRNDNIAKARHTCIYAIRQLTERSLSDIGKLFSRDHTTVIASIKYVEGQITSVPGAESEINDLLAEIKG